MPNLGEARKPDEGLRVLALGKDGSGKSSAIASFADEKHWMYVFDFDHRIDGIRGSTWLDENRKYIDYDQYNSEDGFAALHQKFVEFKSRLDRKDLKYKYFVIDGISSLLYMFYRDSVELKKAAKDRGLRQRGKVDFLTYDDYGYGSTALKMFYTEFFPDFPKINIFMSGWTTERYGKDPKATSEYAPDILLPGQKLLATGKVSVEAPGYFNEVWQFDKEDAVSASAPPQFFVTFRSYLAKTTFPELNETRRINITGKSFKAELDKILKTKEQLIPQVV